MTAIKSHRLPGLTQRQLGHMLRTCLLPLIDYPSLMPKKKPKIRIEIFKAPSGLWYFRLKAANHKIIAQSEGYRTQRSALWTAHEIQYHTANAPIIFPGAAKKRK